MYTIGEVSKIANISANALRYYDEIGLLKPSLIQSNQYRYYSEIQIKDITFILELKQYGFTLDEIKELLQNKNNLKLKLMLEEKYTKLYNEIARLKDNSILLEKRISEIIKEDDRKMKGGKILVVDDLALVRIMIRNIIEQYGYTLAGEASNGKEAVSAYEELRPDLVIMDITMPVMDGIDAAKKIKEKYKDARIIMCSSMSYAAIVLESIKAGACDFISKPFSSLRLMNAVIRSFDDNYSFDVERIDYISSIIANSFKEAAFSRVLKQEDIDTLIYKILIENEQDEFIRDFFNNINSDNINKDKYLACGPSLIEEKSIKYLKDKFVVFSKEISSYLSNQFNEECLMNLLTVENITMSEFKTLLNDVNSTGILKYEIPYSPIYINVNGKIKNEQEILKEVLNFTAKDFNLFIPSSNNIDMFLGSEELKSLNGDYSTILISFSIEFTKGDKGFVAINIPHDFLQFLLI